MKIWMEAGMGVYMVSWIVHENGDESVNVTFYRSWDRILVGIWTLELDWNASWMGHVLLLLF